MEDSKINNISKNIEDFLSFLRSCEQSYHMAVSEEAEQNNVTQDLLHKFELEEHTYHEYASISKELRESRQKRREAKDTMLVATQVVEWVEHNRKVIKDLETLLGAVRKAERNTENRIYTPRSKK